MALLALLAFVALWTAEPGRGAEASACPKLRTTAAYSSQVLGSLRAGRDVWGNALLSAPGGPTYEGAQRYLKPLLLARTRGKKPLTASGVYYLPFAEPIGARGAGSVALHVADGSQIISDRVEGRSLKVSVGRLGRERYGSCLTRLTPARLALGYLPILETAYVDAAGVKYTQESFAARIPQTRSIVSFVRVAVDAAESTVPSTRVRFTSSAGAHLVYSEDGRVDGSSVSFTVPRGSVRSLYVAWVNYPAPVRPLTLDESTYDAARQSVTRYWTGRLSQGMTITVPEERVNNALRGLLVQNLALTWRYSIGNSYEEFSFPEGVDVAQVMGEWGFQSVARSILRTSLTRRPAPYPNWKMGEKLLGSASYYRLYRDRSYVQQATPRLSGYVTILGRQITSNGRGMLARERYSSDIPDSVYGLHSQARAWAGLRAMGSVWAQTGHAALARKCRLLSARLEAGLRWAVRVSQRRLPDGSLFIPVRLLDREAPYDRVTQSRPGSYWNLVFPYALASGLFPPGSPEAKGALRYMLLHGSRILGLVRAGAFSLYREPVHPISGTDQVYGNNVARFLADNDEADQLVLSLYGSLAAAMTPGTFVSGEGASVAPLGNDYYRAMYQPPNGASNAAFLETLRSMLVHETSDRAGNPRGLDLAFATPRAWLQPGQRIVVRRAPTSFGPVSFTMDSSPRSIHMSLEVPSRGAMRTLRIRVRLPRGNRITDVEVNGRPHQRFDARTETIDLSGRTGSIDVDVGYEQRSAAARRLAGATSRRVRVRTIHYRAHNGVLRAAYVVLPAWYGRKYHPAIPLIISPHGRGLSGLSNAALWGNLPARGVFAVVNPDGQGRVLSRYSWGSAGQISDLARMPAIVSRALPWLRIDHDRIYAFGSSMGGQEALLLLAAHPRLLAGAASFDAVTDLALQYRHFARLPCGQTCRRRSREPVGATVQKLARLEVGGSPATAPGAYAARSPMSYARKLAASCVPLQLWYSVADRVIDQRRQSQALLWKIRRLNPDAPVEAFSGFWIHSADMRARSRLPLALATFGLLAQDVGTPTGLHIRPPDSDPCG